jgi:hypothetical protein
VSESYGRRTLSREARVILLDDAAPVEGQYWTAPDDAPPWYSIGEVSSFFLGYHKRWLTDILDEDPSMALYGSLINGQRRYRLYDVERTVHALTAAQRLSPHRARLALLHVRLAAVQYGYLDL